MSLIGSGFPLYLASSVFVRHTMKAFYSDLQVELQKVVATKPTPLRERDLFIGVLIKGTMRVSGTKGQWVVCGSPSWFRMRTLTNKGSVIRDIASLPSQGKFTFIQLKTYSPQYIRLCGILSVRVWTV